MLALMEITISFAYQWIISILIQHVRSYYIRVICTAKFISTPLLYQIKKKPSHEVVYKVYDYNIEIHATKYKKLIFFFSYTCLFDSIQTIANPGESTSPAYSCTYINMTLKRQ